MNVLDGKVAQLTKWGRVVLFLTLILSLFGPWSAPDPEWGLSGYGWSTLLMLTVISFGMAAIPCTVMSMVWLLLMKYPDWKVFVWLYGIVWGLCFCLMVIILSQSELYWGSCLFGVTLLLALFNEVLAILNEK